LHAEALERGVLGLRPGSVAEVVCVDEGAGSDIELGIEQRILSEYLKERTCTKWEAEQRAKPHPLIASREPHFLPPPPPTSLSRWYIRVDMATEGVNLMELHGCSRLDWCARSFACSPGASHIVCSQHAFPHLGRCEGAKEWANLMFKRGDVVRRHCRSGVRSRNSYRGILGHRHVLTEGTRRPCSTWRSRPTGQSTTTSEEIR